MATRACLNYGEQYEPNNWRQLRCNSCRLPPGYGARLRSAAHRSVAREVQAGRLVNLKVDVVASIQLIACDAFRYGDLSMTRVHVGLPTMACIPIRHREAIAREVVAALACIAMEA